MDMPPITLDEVQRLYDRPGYIESVKVEDGDVSKIRIQAVLNAATGVGVKAGLAWQLGNIDSVIKQRARDFDTIYDFGGLMIRGRVVPPVITETRDIYNQDGDHTLRLSGAYYRIERQARFSSVAPHWREYLSFSRPKLDRSMLLTGLLPRGSGEKRIWKAAMESGWRQGVEQANLMLRHGLDKMNRDFSGMIRFHTFVMQGKLTMPAIASESIPVVYDGQSMAVDETLLRITTLPEFNEKMSTWHGMIKSSHGARSVLASPSPSPQAQPDQEQSGRPLDEDAGEHT